MDIANIFHNLPLPPALWDLFPLPTIRLGHLPRDTQQAVLDHLGIASLPQEVLRPAQATTPMGFVSSFILAHVLVSNLVKQAFHLTMQLPVFSSRPNFNPQLSLFQRSQAPFYLSIDTPFALIIIDDISVIFSSSRDSDIYTFHRTLRHVLSSAGLPVSEQKSLETSSVET